MPLLDIWSEAQAINSPMDVLVAPQFTHHFLHALHNKGVHQIQLIKNDIQK